MDDIIWQRSSFQSTSSDPKICLGWITWTSLGKADGWAGWSARFSSGADSVEELVGYLLATRFLGTNSLLVSLEILCGHLLFSASQHSPMHQLSFFFFPPSLAFFFFFSHFTTCRLAFVLKFFLLALCQQMKEISMVLYGWYEYYCKGNRSRIMRGLEYIIW